MAKPFMQVLRENMVATVSAVTTLAALVGLAFAIDGRYALAEDFKTYKQDTQTQLHQYQQQNTQGMAELRRRALEDRVFELELKRGRNPVDTALLNRYKAEIESITRQQSLTRGAPQ